MQFVFAVKHRQHLIAREHKEQLHKYITALVQNRKLKMIALHCMPNHAHIFIAYKPVISIPDLVKEIKIESNEFINDKQWSKSKFNWQEACLPARQGYGAFSYSQSHTDRVAKYVLNQEQHHEKKTFRNEYLEFLKKFEISFEDKYLFEFFD